ncbi:MAG TPA: TadE family protein [Candidatus Solibacter sp.]|jgi:Flp pilus assembly protein TadG
MRSGRRGSTLVESSVVAAVFLLLLAGIMEFGRLGFAYNAVSFAAQRAARYAAVRGGDSGHPASATDVETTAKSYTVALDNTKVTVTTTWTPDNRSGSTVQVKVSYDFGTVLTPLASSNVLTVQTTAREIINQ